ncbi:unnamed protein product [Mytilus edulis]|uniref:Uncharacterized protein n=1 Tax=Mytilus edulis TaxID=6550 RepID=A0A8S3PST2_MYTED|nr:unnamed protein product [Mytilus edulis]
MYLWSIIKTDFLSGDICVSGEPWDLTVIDTDQIAVSYKYLNYIEVIDLKKMAVLNTMTLKITVGEYHTVMEKFYVVADGSRIEVLDMEGTILNTIKCGKNAFHIATIDDIIYYTAPISNTGIIWNFKDRSLTTPGGIASGQCQKCFYCGYIFS